MLIEIFIVVWIFGISTHKILVLAPHAVSTKNMIRKEREKSNNEQNNCEIMQFQPKPNCYYYGLFSSLMKTATQAIWNYCGTCTAHTWCNIAFSHYYYSYVCVCIFSGKFIMIGSWARCNAQHKHVAQSHQLCVVRTYLKILNLYLPYDRAPFITV